MQTSVAPSATRFAAISPSSVSVEWKYASFAFGPRENPQKPQPTMQMLVKFRFRFTT